MRSLGISALAIFALAGTAQAGPAIGGTYQVQGTNHDGSAYGGTARIVATSDTTCEIVWSTGGTTSEGICSRDGDAFAAAYQLGDVVGLAIYHVQANGVLVGTWTIAGQGGNGTETLIPQ